MQSLTTSTIGRANFALTHWLNLLRPAKPTEPLDLKINRNINF